MDPSELEARFSEEEGMAFMGSIFTEPTDESLEKVDKIRSIMESIPDREADFVELFFFLQLRQTQIALIFGVSQPTVCYRLQRATTRIQFLFNRPDISREQLERDMTGFLSDPLDVQIMVQMWETTCQSEVAKRLGISQGMVRHRFIRSVQRMEYIPKFEQHVVLFQHISCNLNILREVQRTVPEGHVQRRVD